MLVCMHSIEELHSSNCVCVCACMCKPRPQISEFNGVDWNLFSSKEEAVAATDEMIAANRIMFTDIDASQNVLTTIVPHLTSKFFYIHVEGVAYVLHVACIVHGVIACSHKPTIVFAHNKGVAEKDTIKVREEYHMGGDLNKAPKMAEAMLEDLGNLQTALGMPSSSKNEEGQADPVPEVIAMQKHVVAVKFAYLDLGFPIFGFRI